MKRIALFLISLLACACIHAGLRYHDEVKTVENEAYLFDLPESQDEIATLAMEVRGSQQDSSKGGWGIVFGDFPQTYYSVTVRRSDKNFDDFGKDAMMVKATLCKDYKSVELFDKRVEEGIDYHRNGYNTLIVEADFQKGTARISLGNKNPGAVADMPIDLKDMPQIVWGVISTTPMTTQLVVDEITTIPGAELQSGWNRESLDQYFRTSTDPLEGFWEYLDRDNDETLARPGGRYLIAIVRQSGSKNYDIIYVDGAEVNSDKWKEGMCRGHLAPTIFIDHYDLVWNDATFNPITVDTSANVEQGAILKLSFPAYRTSLRFVKRSSIRR